MPVPTETFYNIRKLNVVFALCALALLGSTAWLVVADYSHEWRRFQRESVKWQLALTEDARRDLETADHKRQLEELQQQIDQARATLPHERLAQIDRELAELKNRQDRLTLPAAKAKGLVGPKIQEVERAELEFGPESDRVTRLKRELADIQLASQAYEKQLTDIALRTAQLEAEQRELRASEAEIERKLNDIERRKATVEERLAALNPRGLAPKLAKFIRDQPLMDWFNPTEKVHQVVVPDVRTDLNFLDVETIDRCASCHVHIDDPKFDRHTLVNFLERQVAQAHGLDVTAMDRPVALAEFWTRAAAQALEPDKLTQACAKALTAVNALRRTAKVDPLKDTAELLGQLDALLTASDTVIDGKAVVKAAQWRAVVADLVDDLRAGLRSALGQDDYEKLTDLYRVALTEALNEDRKGKGLPALSSSPVLLAHPRLDLFVDAESKHPMKTVGCTVCHEGSGQETHFEHTAHTPRQVWVDARTGAPVPARLIRGYGSVKEIGQWIGKQARQGDEHQIQPASLGHGSSTGADAGHAGGHVYSSQDVNLLDPSDPAPLAPRYHDEGEAAAYASPAQAHRLALAVRQEAYWKEKYGWAHVHYMHWEKPMHGLDYVQSSCIRCHTEIHDVGHEAPRLMEGRKLFAQIGCANCHAVEGLKDALDVKKVGPSLVHVKDKLSPQMAASWVWSPKSFRPTSKMPHYFMLENNSSPVDILRTRTEVTAMAWYLMTAAPPTGTPVFEPQTPPESPGVAARGKALFDAIGCKACHTNLDADGKQWITRDLMTRAGLSREEAEKRFEALSYNQRHTYAKAHLGDQLELTGPELSGVGTKLLAHRTPEQARTWLYSWLRAPRHYNSYTIMPGMRLDEKDANDLTAYLLTLQRPDDWKPDDFGFDESGKPTRLDSQSLKMLTELVVHLKASQSSEELARRETAGQSVEEQLAFLGQKMIGHYGCSGCHGINGFETAVSACTDLDGGGGWGLKDPHKLDFGYFDHTFDAEREKPIEVWKVDHEGLGAAAPGVRYDSEEVRLRQVNWEHMDLERRPWLYHKLHNTRIYDRGRRAFDGDLNLLGSQPQAAIGRPYDKLKMPKFFLTDEQVQALVTYVTGIRKPLVSQSIQRAATPPARLMLARGRQVASLYNCYGCHNIEGNAVNIQRYYHVHNDDGTFNYDKLTEAPPRLIGQGSKTQPDWLVHFLQNVKPIRPWLTVRMPSFFEENPEAQPHTTAIADYFAAWSRETAAHLGAWVRQVDDWKKSAQPEVRKQWFTAPALEGTVAHLRAFGVMADLLRPDEVDERATPNIDDRREAWDRLLKDARFLAGDFDVAYPFPPTPRPELSPERFARGEAFFNELRCFQCHAFGDEDTLLQLARLQGATAPAPAAAPATGGDDYDDYGEAPAKKTDPATKKDDDGYGEDDYGEESAGPAKTVEAFDPVRPQVPEALSHYTAPNLIMAARRLQWNWFDHWLQEPATMQPGTKMPQWFPGGDSAFAKYPHDLKGEKESMFGYSGAEQRKLLMEYLFAAGLRHYTPGSEKLSGQEKPKVELAPLPPPPKVEQPQTAEQPGGEATGPAAIEPSKPAEQPKPVVEADTSSIQLHEGEQPHQGSRIVGVVRFEGSAPRRKPVQIPPTDAFCVGAHPEAPLLEDTLIVNADKTIKNVLVHVKSEVAPGTAPTEAKLIDQHGCVYLPHVSAIVAGQRLVVRNSDNTAHNVRMSSANNGRLNIAQNVRGMEETVRLSRPELGVQFHCDVHPWMGAVVHVLPHGYFGISDVEGRFEITGLPPGKYTLEAVHELGRIAPVTLEVEVKADTSTRVDVTIK